MVDSPIILPNGFESTLDPKHKHCWHSYEAPKNAGIPGVQFCCAVSRGECFDVRIVDADVEGVEEKTHGFLLPTGVMPRIVERLRKRPKQPEAPTA